MMKSFGLLVLLSASVLGSPLVNPKAGHPHGKVIGGQSATRGQFPFTVSLQWSDRVVPFMHICGGIILDETTILSAAHCSYDAPPDSSYSVVAGILNLTEPTSDTQFRNVSSYVEHEDFTGGVAADDIAIYKLENPLVWSDVVQPINLPAESSAPPADGVVNGWGFATTTPGLSNAMQWATVPFLSDQECIDSLMQQIGEIGPFDETQICTGPLSNGIAPCGGDSGGPISKDNVIIGIVSWGLNGCGNNPSVYTEVSAFIQWIENNRG